MKKRISFALAGLLGVALAMHVNAAETSAAEQAGNSAKTAGETLKPDIRKRAQHEMRGDALLDERKYLDAIKEFDAVLAMDPQLARVYVKKGIALYSSGKPKEAVPLLDKAMKMNDGSKESQWWPLHHKGMAQGIGGDLDEAIESFSESIKLKPNDENLFGRAVAFARLQKPELALADARSALGYKPSIELLDMVSQLETQIETEKLAGKYLREMAAKEGAQKTNSGLIYFELKKGDGKNPNLQNAVKVHYHGTLPDGTVFDSSVDRGEPASFPLNSVIPCWTEGLQKMQVGGKSRLVCPAAIAYGNRGAGKLINPGETLTFEVELLAIE